MPLWPGWQRIPQGCHRLVRPPPVLLCSVILAGVGLGGSWYPLPQCPSGFQPAEVSILGALLWTTPKFLSLCSESKVNRNAGMPSSLYKICPPTRCCATHDCCYYRLEKSGCGTKSLKYKYSHRGGQITCSGKTLRCLPASFMRLLSTHMHVGNFAGAGREFIPALRTSQLKRKQEQMAKRVAKTPTGSQQKPSPSLTFEVDPPSSGV